ncbi:ABC-type sugar transport system, permease component [Rubellimicrobium thermophilum DSM 16684]|uniref:ABC-type sugar transport system, permease component n=1 Tax=Rubellimicrobium thermophilum DSM 16684 TaxID=1123069 RepID=S9QS00_9RHOB|nr:carbohydrate ABC transporter permease [Rubellimicrobium thermophilum]EPX82438.1 ABC-type sugar transport system, permease component [Rubellimicrobium thermophilum DSM 16684]
MSKTARQSAVPLSSHGFIGLAADRVRGRGHLRWLVHAVVLLFVLFWFVPILALLLSSLRPQAETAASGWWMALPRPAFTATNYMLAFDQLRVAGSLGTSLAIAIPTTVLVILLSVIGAYALVRMNFAGRTAISLLLVALLVTPPQITLVPLLRLYNLVGLSGTIPGIWLYQVGFTLPFGVFLLRGFIASIPQELFESARLDGASELRIFRSIVLPLSRPIMASLGIMAFLWSWNDLLIPLLFMGGSSLPPPITVNLAGLVAQTTQGQGPLMAATFLSVLVPLVLVLSLQRHFVRGILGGAVKG